MKGTAHDGSRMRIAVALALGLLLHPLGAFAQTAHLGAASARIARGEPWPRQLFLETARASAGVDLAWPSTPQLGAGASVCVIDTGVDLAHPAFRDAAGATRARYVLDLFGAPRGVHPELESVSGGAVYDASDIDLEIAAGATAEWARDWHGHGTAIAGAALGDDAGLSTETPGAYSGVAPRAALVVVRALARDAGGLADEDILAGARFCAAVMDRERGVMLLALGGHDGAHDGSEPLETGLAAWVDAGYVLVAAAGNEGNARIHAGGTVSVGAHAELELVVPDPGARAASMVIAVRTAGRVSVRAPGDSGSVVLGARGARIEREGVTIDARSPRATYVILSGDAVHPLRGGGYQIGLDGGDFDAWITEHDLGAGFDRPSFRGPYAYEGETVAIPATHPSLIAVGACVSRSGWASETGGEGLSLDGEPVTGRAPFSARGPAASGWARPDLLAPGALVRTVLSGAIEPGPSGLFADETELARYRRGEGVVLAGTSIAAALVAGAIALARAESPGASAALERDALITGGADPAGLGAPETRTLDVPGYLAARAAMASGPVSALRSSLSLSRSAVRPGITGVSATVIALDVAGLPAADGPVEIRVADAVLSSGRLRRGLFSVLLPPLEGDVGTELTLEAFSEGTLLGRATLRLAPDERGHAVRPAGGGGCAVGSGSSAVPLLVLVGLLVARRRGREQTQRRMRGAGHAHA